MIRTRALVVGVVLLIAGYQSRPHSQRVSPVTSPVEQFGAAVGDDYFLATYSQFEEYWKRLDAESDRVRLVSIGVTEEGREQWMAIVSAPDNLAQLDRYRDISRRLARAEGLTDAEARALAAEGKAVVWIDGGLHADEVLGAQQLIELVYWLASDSDAETLRVLRDVIVLVVHANPDGHALVADWYMREGDPGRRTLAGLPRLYQKYVGHDNNRDFYLASQAETINMTRVLYREWFPQIVYDHHQPAPAGTVMFVPPFRGPFNDVFDPLIPPSLDLIGAAMQARLAAEGKRGVTTRQGSSYSMWWNGGLRTTAYFHNQIGLLTETIGSPTPMRIPSVPERQVPSLDLPNPIAPQPWRFRQSIDYSMTANRAVLDVASRYRETLLFNAYRMGQRSIARGQEESWLLSPRRLRDGQPLLRAPRGYVLPADQPDFLTAVKFAAALLRSGVAVHRATASFVAAGRRFPHGSYLVKTAQAFRPHVLDMFEPQEPPDDAVAPGAPPTPPYDIAGWTLAYQMGVKVERVFEAIAGPFETVETAIPPAGAFAGAVHPVGVLVGHHQNDAFVVANRVLRAGGRVSWPRDRTIGGHEGTGSMYIGVSPASAPILDQAARELGLVFTGVAAPPAGGALQLRPVRVGLWDRYGGSSASGWIRWILERYEFPFARVYVQELDRGGLRQRFDVLILPGDALPGQQLGEPAVVPAEYRHTTGTMTRERTIPALRAFVEAGGTLILVGEATRMAPALGAPVTDVIDGLSSDTFDVPGSVLQVEVDNRVPLGYGFERRVDVMFDSSPAFRLPADLSSRVTRAAWFGDGALLRSGWARGQDRLAGLAAIVEASRGSGRVLLFGPDVAFRAQTHGAFKFLFNGILSAGAEEVGP